MTFEVIKSFLSFYSATSESAHDFNELLVLLFYHWSQQYTQRLGEGNSIVLIQLSCLTQHPATLLIPFSRLNGFCFCAICFSCLCVYAVK